jgi:hypothetical protein
MSIEFTKVEPSTRQAFYDTLLMSWGSAGRRSSSKSFLTGAMGAVRP